MGEVDLFRNGSWEQLLCCLEIGSLVHRLTVQLHLLLNPLQMHQQSSLVQLGQQQWWHDLAETARLSQQGPGGKPEVLRCASLREVKISRTHKLASQLYQQAKLSLHHCPQVFFFIHNKYHLSSTGLCPSNGSVSADTILPVSLNPQKWQETAAHHCKIFGVFLSRESRQMQLYYPM